MVAVGETTLLPVVSTSVPFRSTLVAWMASHVNFVEFPCTMVAGSAASHWIKGNAVAATTVMLSWAIGMPGLGSMAFFSSVTSTEVVVSPVMLFAVRV